MQYSTLSTCVAGLLTIALASCDATHMKSKELADTEVIGNTADLRMVFRDRANYNWTEDRIIPTRILCAEPSPDVAKVMQAALSGGIGVSIPGQGAASAAASIATAEALAQLGERLATIQLLRDGLYRACEAYANGALTETGYIVMLSRFDDSMVTMLLGELAAGAFGRSLAALGGTADADAEGTAVSLLQMAEDADQAAKLADEQAAAKESEAANTQDPAEAQQKKKEAEALRRLAKAQVDVAATAKVTATATAAGAISHRPDKDVAEQIANMQRKYIENINSDALVVACIHALSKPDAAQSVMGRACWQNGQGILPAFLANQHELLKSVKLRNISRRDADSFDDAVEHMETIMKATKRLGSAAGGQPQQGN